MNVQNKKALKGDVTNGAKYAIEAGFPYTATIKIEGLADMLFHAWNVESVDAKASAAKGSKAKKTDDLESYVYRDDAGTICVPGEYFRGSLINAAKFKQDPRSPRKSAQDLVKAGVVSITHLATTGLTEWDYEDRRRVMVQRNGITRTRPAIRAGWKLSFDVLVTLPEYVSPEFLRDLADNAGRLIGIGDFRPTFGRYRVDGFELMVEK